jgi:hypothetical protein
VQCFDRLQLESSEADEDDLYAAMDWLRPRQGAIGAALARRHPGEGPLLLCDLTSTYFEGRHCPLARYGYSRDERNSNPQILFGVLSNGEGSPVAVEAFPGDTADPRTLAAQLKQLRERFHLRQLVLVGDRGVLTHKRMDEDLRPVQGLDWITALRAPQIQKLAADGVVPMSLLDERGLAEIAHPDYPGERLIVCRNSLLAAARAPTCRGRELMAAAEHMLERIVAGTKRRRRALKGRERIHHLVGRAVADSKVAKYFCWEITSEGFRSQRRRERVAEDAALDGIDVSRTSVSGQRLSTEQTVRTYKRLATVERAFRSLKSVDFEVRPTGHPLPDRVPAHVLICLLACYVDWHMRRALAPVLFEDEQPDSLSGSSVPPTQRSPAARAKALRKRTPDSLPVQSFADRLRDSATIVKNRVETKLKTIPAHKRITLLRRRLSAAPWICYRSPSAPRPSSVVRLLAICNTKILTIGGFCHIRTPRMCKSVEPIVLTPSRRRQREQIAPIRAPRSKSLSGWPSSWAPPRDSPTGNRPAAWAPDGPPGCCGENASGRPGWRACCGTHPDRAATSRSARLPWPRSCVCAWRSGPGRPPTGARARWPSGGASASGGAAFAACASGNGPSGSMGPGTTGTPLLSS